MKKKHKIVMLPTERGETELYKGKKSKVLVKSSHRRLKEDPLDNWEPQHLHILSDDEIKEGDWCYAHNAVNDKIMNKWTKETLKKYPETAKAWKKIIATTDPKLKKPGGLNINKHFNYPIPQIPQSLIEHYVKHKPEEVELEYEYNNNMPLTTPNSSVYKLKLQNNEVVWVEPSKERYNKAMKYAYGLYTLEEVERLCRAAYDEGVIEGFNNGVKCIGIEQWLKKNLK